MKKFFQQRLQGIPIIIPVGISAVIILGLMAAYFTSTISILSRASVETPAASPTVSSDNLSTAAAAPATPAIRKLSFGRANLSVINSSSDFSNPAVGKVFVTLNNLGAAPAGFIDITVEYLNSDKSIIDTEELTARQNSSVTIMPGESHTFEVDNLKQQILKMVSSYHIVDVTWHSRQ
jgi:hypothetical protein